MAEIHGDFQSISRGILGIFAGKRLDFTRKRMENVF